MRIFHEMQDPREKGMLGLGPANVDNGGALKRPFEEADDFRVRVFVQPVEHFIDHEPARFMQ